MNVIVKLRNVNESNFNKYFLLLLIIYFLNLYFLIKLYWLFWNINEIFLIKIMNICWYSIDDIIKSIINVEGEIVCRNEIYNNK